MIIRSECESDNDAIYRLVQAAFTDAEYKDGDEQDYVTELRKSPAYIPGLSFVAEEDGILAGHIMLTKMYIESGGVLYEELLVSPLCVISEYRRRGTGGKLINEGLRAAKERGYTAVFLCGDPAYYGRFGFVPASCFGIRHKMDIPSEYVLALELTPGALKNKQGVIDIV